PPEVEPEITFEPPAVGETVLFATNPVAARVAIVHADDFRIETLPVGPSPLPALAGPVGDVALSLNRGDDTVDILRVSAQSTETHRVSLAHDADTAAFSADGRFALVYE